jgi:CRISPR-associated endonuclease Csy4
MLARNKAMLTHYIDIHLRIDPDFAASQLLSVLYAKVHRALVRLGSDDLAISFPGYSEKPLGLGSSLRVLGDPTRLAQLMGLNWMSGMADHVRVELVTPVPVDAAYRRLIRVQAKSNPDRLRRRLMKRHNVSAAQAQEQVPDSAAEKLRLPFLSLQSSSSGQKFLLFLRLEEPVASPRSGTFNAYGLSATATIPWF